MRLLQREFCFPGSVVKPTNFIAFPRKDIFSIDLKKLTNEKLVFYYQQGNEEAVSELIKRFTCCSKREAFTFYSMYKDVSSVEFDDLVQVGLTSLVIVMDKFSFRGSFYLMWQTVARHEMYELVKQFSICDMEDKAYFTRIESNNINADNVIASGDNVSDSLSNDLIIEKMAYIVSHPRKYNIMESDVKLFKMYYFLGIGYNDIAEKTGINYFTVRSKINRARIKIANILFNSKE